MLETDLPKFALVEPLIYRGGQPTETGWKYLLDLGVTQVIKLNEDSEEVDNVPESVALFKVEISFAEQILTEPVLENLLDAVSFIGANTFIHCKHGEDRTGLLVGMFRVRRCGWTKAAAYAEMIKYGFHPILLGLSKAWADLPEYKNLALK